jgi:hypothetical protein
MKRASVILAAALLVGTISTSFAQLPNPGNGHIGVYSDAAGTQCCIVSGPGSPITFYIIATLGPTTPLGLTGAEFRVEIPGATAFFGSATPNPASNLALGNPIDDPLNATVHGGCNIAFPTCQGTAAGDKILLYTYSGFNPSVGPGTILVKQHTTPSNPNFDCPLVTLCNAPDYTQVCLTGRAQDNGGTQGIVFQSALAASAGTCPPLSCQRVGVEASSWTQIKSLYN